MTTKSGAVTTVIKAFDAFRNAYDFFLLQIETALPDEADDGSDDEALREKVRSLVLGSGDVAIYLRDYGYTIDSMRHIPRK